MCSLDRITRPSRDFAGAADSSMRFRLLGPLSVQGAQIPADKQRTVLAMLLVHAGHVVGVNSLITEVWGDDPPRSAAPNLRGYVMRLRRLLPSEDGLVTTIS